MHPEFLKIFEFEVVGGILLLHAHMFWLNAVALSNMPTIVVTELTFHTPILWLNANAP